jgi:hypothetical protein
MSDHTRQTQKLTGNERAASSIRSHHPAMIARLLLLAALIFLELPDGVTIDLSEASFVDATDDQDARTEFHFPAKPTAAQPSTPTPSASFFIATRQPRPLAKAAITLSPCAPNSNRA